jgi:hypothetical protein
MIRVAPCGVVVGWLRFGGYPEDGGSTVLRNVGILLPRRTVRYPRKPRISSAVHIY